MSDREVVMVVEDDEDLREYMSELLAEDGFDVVTAEDGRHALELLASEPCPDVVVTDVAMPRMNGIQLAEALAERLPRTEVIVVSAYATEATRKKMDEIGIYALLEKPFSGTQLITRLRAAANSDRIVRLRRQARDGAGATSGGRGRILVADDHSGFREMLLELLRDAGYDAEGAADGEQAREMALASDFDIIITDLHMPHLSGAEAIAQIKRENPSSFIVAITGEADVSEILEAKQAGAYECFSKPINVAEFLRKLDRFDIIAASRKRAETRHRRITESIAARTLKEKVAVKFDALSRRFGGRGRLIVTAALAACIIIGLLTVPVARWIARTAETASALAEDAGSAVSTFKRVEGYLQRDEERDLRSKRR